MTKNPECRLTVRLSYLEDAALKWCAAKQNKSVNTILREAFQEMEYDMNQDLQSPKYRETSHELLARAEALIESHRSRPSLLNAEEIEVARASGRRAADETVARIKDEIRNMR
jgi:hypothetical protein